MQEDNCPASQEGTSQKDRVAILASSSSVRTSSSAEEDSQIEMG